MPSGLSSFTPSSSSPIRIERPGIAARHVVFGGEAPHRRRRGLRAAPAGADAKVANGGVSPAVRSLQPRHRRRERGIDADRVVGIAAGFHEGPHRIGVFGLAQQDAVHAPGQKLAELPGIVADMRRVDAVDRRLDDNCRRGMPRARLPCVHHAAHIFAKTGHIEGAVLHADIHVIGPGRGIGARLAHGSAHGRCAGPHNRWPDPAPTARCSD